MKRNIIILFIIILITSLIIVNAKDKDKKKSGENKNKNNIEDSSKKKNKEDHRKIIPANEYFIATDLLGRPTDNSITINVIPAKNLDIYYEYGPKSGSYTDKTKIINTEAGIPIESVIENLKANTRYYYLIRFREKNSETYLKGEEHSFVTQRTPGNTFTFAIQGDSHPERTQQNDPELYKITMQNIQKTNPDFFFTIGDDFSVDTLSEITQEAVKNIYIYQRYFLDIIGSSSPIFLVNGNHEQAALYLLNGTPNNTAVWVQNARNMYYSQPAPDIFYTGDREKVEFIGYLRDYYAWTWGDALFVVIDPYWHSKVAVDNVLRGEGEKRKDMWGITLGDAQYKWLKKTLEQSTSKYKFVFCHHVLGTGRGGIEMADLYEWGGKNKEGTWEFDKKRPGWELPIHQLMVKNNVTIFFQGHDHIFVKQELDGVIYQELPEPADPLYKAYNEDAYKSGVKLPNAGYVKVTVSIDNVKVDYIRSFLPKDEINGHKNGELAYTYTVLPKILK